MDMQKSEISSDDIIAGQRSEQGNAEEELQELRDTLTLPADSCINLDEVVNRIICSAMEEKPQDECLTSEQQKKLFNVVRDRIKAGNIFADLIPMMMEEAIDSLARRMSLTLKKFFSNPPEIRGGLFGHIYRKAVGKTPGLVSCRVKDIDIETNVVLKNLIDVDINLCWSGKPFLPRRGR